MICGGEKTAYLLYKINDEYGQKIEWFPVILGMWHLHIFFKRNENIMLRTFLSKILTIANKWWKYHNYSAWMVSSFIRENVKQFLKKY